MSREALSLEIAGVVSRVVRGEAIDTAESGAALAEKFPDIGMSGAQIGQAIERAAGMVGMMRDPSGPIKPAPAEAAPANGAFDVNGEPGAGNCLHNGGEADGSPSAPKNSPVVALPAATLLIDHLATEIGVEIGASVATQSMNQGLLESPIAAADRPAAVTARTNGAPPGAAPIHGESGMPVATGTSLAPSASLETLEVPAAVAMQPPNSIFSSLRRAIFRT